MNSIIDLHAHPQLKPLNSSLENRQRLGIWQPFEKSGACEELGVLLRSAIQSTWKKSQANLDQALSSGVKGIFLAMGPVERNFFDPKRNHWLLKLILQKKKLEDFATCLTGFDREKVGKIFKRVREERGIDYYTEELLEEYRFLSDQTASGKLVIAENFRQFRSAFQSDNQVASLLSIEGAHSLGNYEEVDDFWRPVSAADENKIYNRLLPHFEANINHMKKWGGGKHCPLFLTFCHHFSNLLAGHAKSFPSGNFFKPGMDDLLDQRNGKDEGFSKLGWSVLEMLLSKSNGRRVLIDVKHMSTLSRMEFFAHLKREYHDRGDSVPIICSHGAFNGYKTLENALKRDRPKEYNRNYLSRQAINISDEEAKLLVNSGGLIGLVLHGGRLPGGAAKKKMKAAQTEDEKRDAAVELIMSNVFHFIRAVGQKEAWDCISLGTDMDGVIEALPPYRDYRELKMLPLHIRQFLHRPFDLNGIGMNKAEVINWMFDLDPETIVEKFFQKNALDFLEKYFHEGYLRIA